MIADHSTFESHTYFTSAEFHKVFRMYRVRFLSSSSFDGARFLTECDIDECKFSEDSFFELNDDEYLIIKMCEFKRSIALSDRSDNRIIEVHSGYLMSHGRIVIARENNKMLVVITNIIAQHYASFLAREFKGTLRIERCRFEEALILGRAADDSGHLEISRVSGSLSLRHTHARRLVMEGLKFDRVPDFVGMHVDGPVDLDLVDIDETEPQELRGLDPRERAAELAARWRALKRLAEQGRHHWYTALYARNENRARAPLDRDQRPLAALLGRIYGALSDYGLSLWRPWAWWGAFLLLGTLLYWDAHLRMAASPGFACGDGGPVNAFWSALLLALRQGSVLGNLAGLPGSEWITACLYGSRVPAPVVLLAGVQSAVSAVLLFLFLLAVRNHFRVR